MLTVRRDGCRDICLNGRNSMQSNTIMNQKSNDLNHSNQPWGSQWLVISVKLDDMDKELATHTVAVRDS